MRGFAPEQIEGLRFGLGITTKGTSHFEDMTIPLKDLGTVCSLSSTGRRRRGRPAEIEKIVMKYGSDKANTLMKSTLSQPRVRLTLPKPPEVDIDRVDIHSPAICIRWRKPGFALE